MGKITTLTPEELAMVAKKPSEEAIEAVEKTGDQDALEKVKQLASMAADGPRLGDRGAVHAVQEVRPRSCERGLDELLPPDV